MAGVDRQLKLAMTGSQGAGNMGIGCQAIGSLLILIKMDAGQEEYGFPGTGMQEAAGSPGIANNLYGEKVMKKGKAIISMGLIIAMFFLCTACPPRRRPPRRVIVVPLVQVISETAVIA